MEKIFKKSLALVLSAALCLTAFVGCLTVSAADETTTPIYEMVGAEGKAGETVTVTAKLQNIEGICAHHVKFTFAKELTVVSMHDVTRDKPVKFDTDVAEGENFQFKKSIDTNTGVTTVEDVNILNFVKSDNTYDEHTPSLTLTFSVKIADGTADGNYAVNVTANAADQGEAWVNTIDFRNSNVVVKNTVAPVVDATLKPVTGILTDDTIGISYAFDKSTLENYSSYYLVIERNTRDNKFNFTKTSLTIDSILDAADRTKFVNGTRINFYYYGLELYSLNVPVSATLYCRDEGGNVVALSEVNTTSVTDIIREKYSSARAALKTTYIDLLNLGTAAQAYYSNRYPNSDYAKIEAPNKGFSQVDATKELGELSRIDQTIPEDSTAITTSGAIGSAPYLMFYVYPTDISKINDYKLVLSYKNKLTNTDVVINVNGSDMQLSSTKDKYLYNMRDIKLYASDVDVTAKLYVGDSSTPIVEKHYSYEQYIYDKVNDVKSSELLVNLMDSVGKFSASFRTLKGIN